MIPNSRVLKTFISTPNLANKIDSGATQKNLSDEDDSHEGLNPFTGVVPESHDHESSFPTTPPLLGERTSIMQTISNIWNGNPANFLPLIYPS